MMLPTDDYDVTEMEGSEKAYVERMRAAIAPGFMDALASQLAALATAAMAHYEEGSEEGDDSKPIASTGSADRERAGLTFSEIAESILADGWPASSERPVMTAFVWMQQMVDIAARDAYQRATRAAEERGR
jgi:hypothetical protein